MNILYISRVQFHFSWAQIHTTEIPKITYRRKIKISLDQKRETKKEKYKKKFIF